MNSIELKEKISSMCEDRGLISISQNTEYTYIGSIMDNNSSKNNIMNISFKDNESLECFISNSNGDRIEEFNFTIEDNTEDDELSKFLDECFKSFSLLSGIDKFPHNKDAEDPVILKEGDNQMENDNELEPNISNTQDNQDVESYVTNWAKEDYECGKSIEDYNEFSKIAEDEGIEPTEDLYNLYQDNLNNDEVITEEKHILNEEDEDLEVDTDDVESEEDIEDINDDLDYSVDVSSSLRSIQNTIRDMADKTLDLSKEIPEDEMVAIVLDIANGLYATVLSIDESIDTYSEILNVEDDTEEEFEESKDYVSESKDRISVARSKLAVNRLCKAGIITESQNREYNKLLNKMFEN